MIYASPIVVFRAMGDVAFVVMWERIWESRTPALADAEVRDARRAAEVVREGISTGWVD